MNLRIEAIIVTLLFTFSVLSLVYSLDLLNKQTVYQSLNQTSPPVNTVTQTISTSTSEMLNSSQSKGEIFNIETKKPSLLSSYFDYLIFSIMIALSIFSLFALFSFSSGKPSFKFRSRKTYEESSILEFKQMLSENIDKLDLEYVKNSNPILELYRKVCEFLEKKGVVNAPQLTAKEFENEVYKILGRKIKGFDILTNIFEEVRYSNHELDETKIKYTKTLVEDIIKQLEDHD